MRALVPAAEAGSWQAKQDEIWFETEQRVRAEYVDEFWTLNPVLAALAPLLGPVQAHLGRLNQSLRLLRRLLAWEDRILTFQVVLANLGFSLACIVLGVAVIPLPWARIWEVLFRLLGVALFGPHMHWVGQRLRMRWAAYIAQSHAYETGDAGLCAAMEAEHAAQCETWLREMILAEVYGAGTSPDVITRQAKVEEKYDTCMVRPRPTTTKLRFLHRADPTRSEAYCTFASEDRPPLEDVEA